MGGNQVKALNGPKDEDDTATPILMSSINSEADAEKEKADIHRLAYLGYVDEIKEIMDRDDFSGESIVRKLDSLNKTPVHNAAMGGGRSKVEIVSILLTHDIDDIRSSNLDPVVNLRDIKGRTALHYAAASKRPDLIARLLNDFNADPNIADIDGCTPLHICASQGYSENAVTCLEVLLTSPKIDRYKTCGPERFNQSPVHLAAESMADRVLKCLLQKGFHHGKKDSRGLSPLHLAVLAGDTPEAVTCVEELLKISDIKEVNAISEETGQAAIHMAAYKCHFNVLRVLLDDTNTNIWILDKQRRTALHWATEAWFRNQSLACVELLVKSDKISDWHDKAIFLYGENSEDPEKRSKNETAMDIALKHKAIRIAEYLIQAHPDPEAWLDDKMMEKIYKTLPEAMIPLMDHGLTYNPAKFHERNESIDAEFGSLIGYKEPVKDEVVLIRHETQFLHNILDSPKEIQQSLILHPLVQMFIDLKWKKIRLLTWLAILFQFTWLGLYTTYVFEVFVPDCRETPAPGIDAMLNGQDKEILKNKTKTLKILLSLGFYSKEDSNIRDCEFHSGAAISIVGLLYFMSAIVVIKEFFQMKNNSKYFESFANWAQWTLLIVFFINSFPAFYTSPEIPKWQIYLAAFGMFVGWVLSLREMAKFPNGGIYSALLKRVFWHCLKMLVFYVPLLVAFSMSLMLLIPGKGQYNYLFFGIVKVLIMMTGELDFEDSFYDDEGPKIAMNFILGQFVFLLLVFITTIVLLNLLTGLAVNDVQSLIEEAEINRLSNELEQIYLFESLLLFVREKLGNKESFAGFFHRFNVTSVETPDYHYFVSKLSGIQTRPYSQDLKKRIKNKMVADESDD